MDSIYDPECVIIHTQMLMQETKKHNNSNCCLPKWKKKKKSTHESRTRKLFLLVQWVSSISDPGTIDTDIVLGKLPSSEDGMIFQIYGFSRDIIKAMLRTIN